MDSPSEDEDLKLNPTDQQQQEDSSTPNPSDIENAEDSSNSEKSEDETSTFDVVMNAIKPEDEDEDKSESNSDEDDEDDSEKDPKGEKKDDSEAEDEEFEDFSDEERANLNKKTAVRFDKLKGLYHKSKENEKLLTAQLEEATVDAGRYRQFAGFLEQNRITEQEANELFDIGAYMKNDPVKALELITPYFQQLLHITGNILPNDLEQQVQQGYISRENALELSRSRAQGKTNTQIAQEQQVHQQNQQQKTQRQQHEQQTNTIVDAISDWERKWSSSDPDYETKKDRVLDRVELMLIRASNEGKAPKTVEDAQKIADEARRFVEKDLKQFAPKKKVQSVDGGSTVTSQPAPNNTADVIRRTLNQTN